MSPPAASTCAYRQPVSQTCRACTVSLDLSLAQLCSHTCRVEYFGQKLDGFCFTEHGWVQSYGSRYVRPPIIHGDVKRQSAMTVKEFKYAQDLTKRPVKGMLTGPVTILNWSFPRKDITREAQAFQVALALREEVADLEAAGCRVIQVRVLKMRVSMFFVLPVVFWVVWLPGI